MKSRIVTAYSWVRRSKVPLGVFATIVEAERWLDDLSPELMMPLQNRSPTLSPGTR